MMWPAININYQEFGLLQPKLEPLTPQSSNQPLDNGWSVQQYEHGDILQIQVFMILFANFQIPAVFHFHIFSGIWVYIL